METHIGIESLKQALEKLLGDDGAVVIVFPGKSEKQSPAKAFKRARLTLGKAMYRAGIDDGSLIAQLRELEQQAPSRSVTCRRTRLLLELADAALEEHAPLPGAQSQYDKAREARATFDVHRN